MEIMSQEKSECPKCKSENITVLSATETWDGTVYLFKCNDCGTRFS